MTPRWQRCPSTHCERSQECRAPHDCTVKPKPPQLALAPGRYCEHGKVVPGPKQLLALAVAHEENKVSVCIDWCDDCMGITRREHHDGDERGIK